MSDVQQYGSSMIGKNSIAKGLEMEMVVGLPAQNIYKSGIGVHGKKNSVHNVVKFHSLDLDTKDLINDDGEFDCTRGCDIDDLNEIPKLAQEMVNESKIWVVLLLTT
ncbi:hypothetical protein ACH5RR_040212 [Cinchona calisaya]|uniref:Uncharacterized protein n=1 Tax=Cinchona calisaya TaxID=153742 RepID=A0ABD2XTZ4_9GENT